MTPRPLYRWKSFWLGVLVLGFMGWAWWISYSHVSHASYKGAGVMQQEGHVAVGYAGTKGVTVVAHEKFQQGGLIFQVLPPPFMVRGLDVRTSLVSGEEMEFEEQKRWFYATLPKECWAVFLPHWMLVTVFAGAWVSFLVWRMRKQRGLTEATNG